MAATAKGTIAEALFAVQGAIQKVQKDSINPHFGHRYVGLPTLMEVVMPVLQKNKLLLSQVMDHVGDRPALRTVLLHIPSGEMIEGTCPLELQNQNAQGVGSAVTYYRRYGLMSALGLVADEDDDGNAASAKQSTVASVQTTPAIRAEALPSAGDGIGGAIVL